MAPHKRILLLGPTGVDKAGAITRLNDYLKRSLGHQFRFVDFENEYLKKQPNVKNWMTFLAQDIAQQSSTWLHAWEEFQKSLDGEPIILGLHATYVSGILGLRSPISIPKICDGFAPTMIVSLIDDVFRMWSRTEARAEGKEYKGRPTFEQLLVARRAEQLLGDIILSHLRNPKARHITCAISNSIDALTNLFIFDATVTYLSFPISSPRELQEKGDNSFIELINHAHHLAAAEMRNERARVFITPLAIDELPIKSKAEKEQDGKTISFNCHTDRWNQDELWGSSDIPILPATDASVDFPRIQIDDAVSAIRTDVGWRDRRLVLQSNSLAIVCPKPPDSDRVTRGVADEIQTAVTVGIVCNYWQKPEWDPGDYVGNQFPAAGSMGIGQTQALVRSISTLEELIRTKP